MVGEWGRPGGKEKGCGLGRGIRGERKGRGGKGEREEIAETESSEVTT